MKMLRDHPAKAIYEDRSPEAKLDGVNEKSAGQALMVERLAPEQNPATAKLEEAIREVTGGRTKAERILEYYDNIHTSPRNRTVSPKAG